MKQTIIIFSSLSIVILILFQLSKYSLNNLESISSDFYIFFAGTVFILVGFYIHRILYIKPKSDQLKVLKDSKLSKQEHRILSLINEGFSNIEIADKLFIAESTVKKHVSNILNKLNAKRRTEAVKIGRDLEII